MQSKFVFVTEIKTATTTKGKAYTYFLDQDKLRWNMFGEEKAELNKGYVLDFEKEGEWSNIKAIKPVINVFHQKALAETANRNDYKRDYSFAIGQAIEFFNVTAPPDIVIDDVLDAASVIYGAINKLADSEMAKLQTEDNNAKSN